MEAFIPRSAVARLSAPSSSASRSELKCSVSVHRRRTCGSARPPRVGVRSRRRSRRGPRRRRSHQQERQQERDPERRPQCHEERHQECRREPQRPRRPQRQCPRRQPIPRRHLVRNRTALLERAVVCLRRGLMLGADADRLRLGLRLTCTPPGPAWSGPGRPPGPGGASGSRPPPAELSVCNPSRSPYRRERSNGARSAISRAHRAATLRTEREGRCRRLISSAARSATASKF